MLHAGVMIRDLPENSLWSFGGVGDNQLMMNSVALAIGGGVRIGLEDNIWFDLQRTKLATNADLINRIHDLAKANARQIMTPRKLRELLGLSPGNGKYGVSNEG